MKKILEHVLYISDIKKTYGCDICNYRVYRIICSIDRLFQYARGDDKKIIWSCMVLVGIWILVFLATTSFVLLKKKYKLFDVNDGHAVYCHYRYQSSSIASAQACNSPSNAIAT